MNKFVAIMAAIMVLSCTMVLADYWTSGNNDFSVYIDPEPYLDGKMFATVDMSDNISRLSESYRCMTLIFINSSGNYQHIQSNPTLASSSGISLRVGKTTPEELGYFAVENGVGTVYWREFNQVTDTGFLYVVRCNSNNDTLSWQSPVVPKYRELGKTLPGRAAWFTQQGDMLGGILFLILFIMLIIYFITRLFR